MPENLEEQILHRREQELQALHHVRKEAQDLIKRAQARQKQRFKEQHQIHTFKIRDQVLLYQSHFENSWSAKLKEK